MGNFNDAYKIVSVNEGLYNKGGVGIAETYKGIDRKQNPNWKGWAIIDRYKPLDVPAMNLALSLNKELQAEIITFFVNGYWNPIKLSQVIDQNICNNALDCSINQGLGIAAKFIQRACNSLKSGSLIVDGQIGPKTLSVINSLNAESIYNEINNLRLERYIDTANSNPDFKQWLKVWAKRLTPYNHNLINH